MVLESHSQTHHNQKDKTMENTINTPAAAPKTDTPVVTLDVNAIPTTDLKKIQSILKQKQDEVKLAMGVQKSARKDEDQKLRQSILDSIVALPDSKVLVKVEDEKVEVSLEEALFGHECTINAQVRGAAEGVKAPRKFTAKLDSIRLNSISKMIKRLQEQFKGEVTHRAPKGSKNGAAPKADTSTSAAA